MRAGKLRHQVVIQEPTRTPDGAGNYDITWTNCTNGTVWASIEPLSGRELWDARQVDGQTTHRVRLRYFKGLTSHHRLKFGTRIFHLEQPPLDADERGVELELLCREDADGDT